MLNRHRILLDLLSRSGGTLGKTAFVKLCFLLSRESSVPDTIPFYDFLPYKYGPFSFTLYHDVESLSGQGLIREDAETISMRPDAEVEVGAERARLSARVSAAVDVVVAKYGGMRKKELLKSVYTRYPKYAVSSEIYEEVMGEPIGRRVTPVASAVFTAGYRGESIDAFFARLLDAGIQAIIDVRNNPVSRKYGFAGSRLRDLGTRVGMAYHHVPALGIPSAARKSLGSPESYAKLFDAYEVSLSERDADIRAVAAIVQDSPSALLCAEEDPAECHRSRLAKAISSRTRMPIVHLRGGANGESSCPDHGEDVPDPVRHS